MPIKELIHQHIDEFIQLCEQHKVKKLYVFGSSLTDRFTENSDIEMLVEIDESDPVERGEALMNLWDQLESFFQRRVDLLTEASIKNPVLRNSIEATKTLVYDRGDQKVFV